MTIDLTLNLEELILIKEAVAYYSAYYSFPYDRGLAVENREETRVDAMLLTLQDKVKMMQGLKK